MILSLANAVYEILGIAMKTVFLMAGAAIIVGLVFKEANGPPHDNATSHPKTLLVRDDRGRIIVSLEDDEKQDFSKFVLRDKEGSPLIHGTVYPDKSIIFSLGNEKDDGLVRSVGYTTTNGRICLGVWNGKSQYKLSASKDGSSMIELVDLDKEVLRRFRVTPGGDFVDDLPVMLGDQ